MYTALDPLYKRPATNTFALELKTKYQQTLEEGLDAIAIIPTSQGVMEDRNSAEVVSVDTMAVYVHVLKNMDKYSQI